MKKLLYASAALLITACNPVKKPATNVTITGLIKNPVTDHVFIKGSKEIKSAVVDSIFVDRGGEYVAGFGIVDKDGKFVTSFTIDEPAYYKYYHGRESTAMYLLPGDSIHISIDAEEFDETISYNGTGEAVNNFLAKKFLLKEEISVNGKKLYSLEPEQFISHTDSVRAVMQNHLSAFLDSVPGVDEQFKRLETAAVLYSWTGKGFNYSSYHKYYTGTDSVDLGDAYDNYISNIDMNDAELIALSLYVKTLNGYLKYETDKELEKDSTLKELENPAATVKMRLVKEMVSDEKLKNLMLYSVINQQIRSNGIYKTEGLIADFEKICTNPEYLAAINKQYGKWGTLAEGHQAPQFAFPDINGDTINMSDFLGKYIYIDVWATWCGACKKEIPYLEKLQEKYKDKNIVFVSISVDNTKPPWEAMVKSKNMKGVQLFAEGWASDFVKDCKIRSIPRFILIDGEGKIITVKAPRPSGGIEEVLEKLVGMKS